MLQKPKTLISKQRHMTLKPHKVVPKQHNVTTKPHNVTTKPRDRFLITAQKTKFFFSKCSERIVFLKKLHWNITFLVLCIMVFFPESMILFSDGKWKMIFLKKYVEIWYFLHIRWIWYFFFPEIWYFPSAKKSKDDLLPKEYTVRWHLQYHWKRWYSS